VQAGEVWYVTACDVVVANYMIRERERERERHR
jgi:hypothetical protein